MLFMNEGSMSFWQKLFAAPQQLNEHKNQIACVDIKRVLASRGYSRKELNEITHSPLQ